MRPSHLRLDDRRSRLAFVRWLPVLIIFHLISGVALGQTSGDKIRSLYSKSIMYVAVRGQTADRTICRPGTGFLISSDGYVITAWHLLTDPKGNPLTNPVIRGSVADPFDCTDPIGDIRPLELVSANRDQDIALLRIRSEKGPFDYVSVCRDTSVDPGSTLWLLGFPLGQALQPISTTLGSRAGPRGFWQIGSPVDPGFSGGPVFTDTGRLAGIVWGDVDEAKSLGFVVPAQHVMDLFLSAGVRTDYCRTPNGSDVAQTCVPIFKDYNINDTKDDHDAISAVARAYVKKFSAEDGFRIKSFEWKPLSSNNASEIDINVSADRQQLSTSFRLTSGPIYDRWRGWISGRVSTVQLPQECFSSQ